MNSALAVSLLLAALLAGCAGDGGGPDTGTDTTANGGDEASTAAGNGTALAAAPVWQVGSHWSHHWQIGSDIDFTLKSIVVENGSSDYVLATDREENAAFAASFFFPDVGRMSKSDWTVRDGDFAFPWYSFPLEDGKTWTGNEMNVGPDLMPITRSLDLKSTAQGGGKFLIETSEGGTLRARYDYDPALQWFSSYQGFALDAAGEPVVEVEVTTTSSGQGFTGTYYQAAADMVLNLQSVLVPAAPSAPAYPLSIFTVPADATHVLAILFAFAVPGASHTQLLAPDGQHWEATGVGDHEGNTLAGTPGLQFMVPAVIGEWQAYTAGAGGFAWGGGAFAWVLVMTTASL
ncbi:MAG: hypothetical protein AABY18_00245 [Candidatus Thermoplasmatota archaeon]